MPAVHERWNCQRCCLAVLVDSSTCCVAALRVLQHPKSVFDLRLTHQNTRFGWTFQTRTYTDSTLRHHTGRHNSRRALWRWFDSVLCMVLSKWAFIFVMTLPSDNIPVKFDHSFCKNLLTDAAHAWKVKCIYVQPVLVKPALNTFWESAP